MVESSSGEGFRTKTKVLSAPISLLRGRGGKARHKLDRNTTNPQHNRYRLVSWGERQACCTKKKEPLRGIFLRSDSLNRRRREAHGCSGKLSLGGNKGHNLGSRRQKGPSGREVWEEKTKENSPSFRKGGKLRGTFCPKLFSPKLSAKKGSDSNDQRPFRLGVKGKGEGILRPISARGKKGN